MTDDFEYDQFSADDIDPTTRQTVNNADFADTMLEKAAFINTLSPHVIPLARLIEKNIALSNFSDNDIIRMRHKVDDIINTYLMQFPPSYHTFGLQHELEKVKVVAEWEGTRAKGGTERKLLATQLSESTINQNSSRDRQGTSSWIGRLSKAFAR
ncbi:MAG: hypothetical protein LBE57_04830 [Methanosarcinales archaeon]|jgi:hypothetical protein|nr:hypothetical protein [Methanosarcinales archaeon]